MSLFLSPSRVGFPGRGRFVVVDVAMGYVGCPRPLWLTAGFVVNQLT